MFSILDQKDLPWLNPSNNKKQWLKLSRKLRLILGKIEHEQNSEKERTIH